MLLQVLENFRCSETTESQWLVFNKPFNSAIWKYTHSERLNYFEDCRRFMASLWTPITVIRFAYNIESKEESINLSLCLMPENIAAIISVTTFMLLPCYCLFFLYTQNWTSFRSLHKGIIDKRGQFWMVCTTCS